MSNFITQMGHEACGSSDALSIYEKEDGSVDGYCWSCGTYVQHPYGESVQSKDIPKQDRKDKSAGEIEREMEAASSLDVCDLVGRKLRAASLDAFGIKIGLSEQDGKTPTFVYFPYRRIGELIGYKVRLLEPKRMWSIGSLKDVDPFGWQEAMCSGARKLIITEGEMDAVALHRIFEIYTKQGYEEYKPAIISLPHGAGCAPKYLQQWRGKIEDVFDEVALCFDDDEPGREAVAKVSRTWHEVKVIKLPLKDANECLMKGVGRAAYRAAYWKAEPKKNTNIVFGEDLHALSRVPATYGELSWPWAHINEATKGIRLGETMYLGAGPKMGKSTVLNEMGTHFIEHDGVQIFCAKPEEANSKTYKLMAGAIAGKIFHDPDIPFDEEAYDLAGDVLNGKLAMVDLYQHLGWKTLQKDIYAAAGWGAKVAFIDPITNLTNGVPSNDANVVLQGIAQDLAAMSLDLGMFIMVFCHLKANQGQLSREGREKYYREQKYIGLGGCPHGLGGDCYADQFAGSRAMQRSCNIMVALEGNKDPDLPPEVRNIRELNILEEREFGAVGRYQLFWNKNTGKLEAI